MVDAAACKIITKRSGGATFLQAALSRAADAAEGMLSCDKCTARRSTSRTVRREASTHGRDPIATHNLPSSTCIASHAGAHGGCARWPRQVCGTTPDAPRRREPMCFRRLLTALSCSAPWKYTSGAAADRSKRACRGCATTCQRLDCFTRRGSRRKSRGRRNASRSWCQFRRDASRRQPASHGRRPVRARRVLARAAGGGCRRHGDDAPWMDGPFGRCAARARRMCPAALRRESAARRRRRGRHDAALPGGAARPHGGGGRPAGRKREPGLVPRRRPRRAVVCRNGWPRAMRPAADRGARGCRGGRQRGMDSLSLRRPPRPNGGAGPSTGERRRPGRSSQHGLYAVDGSGRRRSPRMHGHAAGRRG